MTETPRRVLLVEDDESLRTVLSRHLRGQGYEIAEATSAETAAAAIADGFRPGLVLLDINLPGQTGWELLRGSALETAGSPPVVVATATTVSPRLLAEFHVAGYLPKPFPLETLVATIERLLGATAPSEEA